MGEAKITVRNRRSKKIIASGRADDGQYRPLKRAKANKIVILSFDLSELFADMERGLITGRQFLASVRGLATHACEGLVGVKILK